MERDAHSRASVYSNDSTSRDRHAGIVMWLDEALSGFLEQSYVGQAQQALGINQPLPPVEGANPWMEEDGLE